MTSECVCGFSPPEDHNPDCERCNLICRIAELETACRAALETLNMQIKREREEFHIPHYTAKAIWDETIAELEAVVGKEKREAAAVKSCPYCGEPIRSVGGKRKLAHRYNCPGLNWRAESIGPVEREMPDVEHAEQT